MSLRIYNIVVLPIYNSVVFLRMLKLNFCIQFMLLDVYKLNIVVSNIIPSPKIIDNYVDIYESAHLLNFHCVCHLRVCNITYLFTS